MNTLVWTLQIVLGILFTVHGVLLMVQPSFAREQLEALPYSKGFLRFIGLAEVLGGLGLVLPWWFAVAPFLTPLAALGLTVIMLGALVTHARAGKRRQAVVTTMLSLLLLFMTIARWE